MSRSCWAEGEMFLIVSQQLDFLFLSCIHTFSLLIKTHVVSNWILGPEANPASEPLQLIASCASPVS